MERVLNLLQEIGLTRDEAKVYVCLAKRGPQTIKALTDNLQISRSQVAKALKGLKEKQIATRRKKYSTHFQAITFEKILTDYVKIQFNQARKMQEKRATLIADWREMIEKKI